MTSQPVHKPGKVERFRKQHHYIITMCSNVTSSIWFISITYHCNWKNNFRQDIDFLHLTGDVIHKTSCLFVFCYSYHILDFFRKITLKSQPQIAPAIFLSWTNNNVSHLEWFIASSMNMKNNCLVVLHNFFLSRCGRADFFPFFLRFFFSNQS